MANASRDQNSVPTLLAVSSADGVTPVVVWADPVTHRLLAQLIGGSGSGFQQPLSGTVDGSNTTFTWATAPSAIVIDEGKTIQKTNVSGFSNWTGTTTTVLAIAPTFDIFAVA